MLKFYTDVMGIGAGVVGMLMMAARFLDAFTDITMGQIVDRSKPGKDRKISSLDKADVWSGCDFQFFDLPVSICRYAILV